MKHTDFFPNTYARTGLFARELLEATTFRLAMSGTENTMEFQRIEKVLHRYIVERFPDEDIDGALAINQTKMMGFLIDQIHLLREHVFFKESGRNIIHVEPVLCELFANTDVDDVILTDLKWPYDRFYVHYGNASRIAYSIHSVVGAYVHIHFEQDYKPGRAPLNIDLSVVTHTDDKHRDRSDSFLARVSNDPTHHISLIADPGERAIDALHWSQNAVLSDKFSHDDDKNWTSVYPNIARLIINTLCFVTAPGSDIVEARPDDTPARLLKQSSETDGGASRRRAISKLDSMGYSSIRICGRDLQRKYKDALGEHAGPRPHWRRGHWRHQRHGMGLSLRKLVWIKPVLVAKDKGDPSQGHIYDL
ncbi:MAG: hypothetical protein NT154_12955 [Verrucomicrobia bacterium]|nr:hypothetical protein [Verrucomicrobiota bacterium]